MQEVSKMMTKTLMYLRGRSADVKPMRFPIRTSGSEDAVLRPGAGSESDLDDRLDHRRPTVEAQTRCVEVFRVEDGHRAGPQD